MSFDSEQFDSQKLADALRAAYTHRAAVPPSIDSSILSAARQSFDARRRRRMMIRWGTGLAASLAAALALAIILHPPATPTTTLAKAAIVGDLNADGRVDMADALLLAKHVAAHDHPDPTWDANADSVVDQKDIDALATAAVSLKQPALATHRLPALHDLGLDRLQNTPVGLASASGIFDTPNRISLAEASPTRATNHPKEAHQ
jgi:hypothetical protein